MSISRQLLFVCAIWCFLDKVPSVLSRPNTETSPCRSLERCISISQCPSLRDLLIQREQNPMAAAILTKKRCGAEYKSSKVCCPPTIPPVATPSTAQNFSECGKSKKVKQLYKKISGGEDAALGSWPWMVALFDRSDEKLKPEFEFRCGASLISRQWVITAAHCILVDKEDLVAQLGDLDLDNRVKDGASLIISQIDEIVTYPEYDNDTLYNDIALIRLKNPVNFTENIRPICLHSSRKYTTTEYYYQKQAFIIGWGRLGENEKKSSRLQEASVNVTAIEKCTLQYSGVNSIVIDGTVLCAKGPGKDTCKGDSGGPLMFFNNTEARFYLGGITSQGEGCARENYPGLYTRVAQYISWINEVIGESF